MLPRRRRLLRRLLISAALVALILLMRLAPHTVAPISDPQHVMSVQRVVDGDTLILAGGQRVRLLGVDTPELARNGDPAQPWSEAALDFLKQSVEGREVSLGFDREPFDKYGRRLAYVYRRGTLINEELIRHGLSPAKTGFPYSGAMKDRFRRAEREAKANRRGLWSEERSTPIDHSLNPEELEDQ